MGSFLPIMYLGNLQMKQRPGRTFLSAKSKYSKILVFQAEYIDLGNVWVHAAVVQVQVQVQLPLDVVDRAG